MLKREPFSGAAESRLDLIGGQQCSIPAAKLLRARPVIVARRIMNALALNGLDEKRGEFTGPKFSFKNGEVVERNRFAFKKPSEAVLEHPAAVHGE